MANPNSVKFVEVCKVAPQPSSPDSATPPPPETLPLTLFDILWLRFPPVQRLFFYEISSSNFINNSSFFHSILIPKLKISLSLTLQQFLPLAGNITWSQISPKPVLSYVQGDTVSFTIVESDADHFSRISSNTFVEAEEYHPLIPQLAVSHEKAAAMALQVTIFPNRGFSIGTSMHHAILDGKTSTMFVKAWAHICKHIDDGSDSNILLPDQLKPFFDRRVVRDPAGLEPIFVNQILNMDSDRPNNRSLMLVHCRARVPDSIRGTFIFTRSKIEALKQLVKEKKQQQQHLSTFSLTCAYAWICFLKAKEVEADQAAAMIMGFTVDSRSRLDPPIPANYLGNCLVGRLAVAESKALLEEDGLTVAVDSVGGAIKSLDEGILNGAENWIPLLYSTTTDYESILSIAGSPRFGIYETDFGWGRPNKVEIVSIESTGAMSLSESKDGGAAAGGVEIGLVLKKHHMEAFATLFAEGLANL